MTVINDLQYIFDNIHNVESTSTMPPEFEYSTVIEPNTWFDKYILRWF